jgi:hypothetical protein
MSGKTSIFLRVLLVTTRQVRCTDDDLSCLPGDRQQERNDPVAETDSGDDSFRAIVSGCSSPQRGGRGLEKRHD